MAFTSGELVNIANATLDYHIRKGAEAYSHTIQERPLIRELDKRKKPFSAAKEQITVPAKGEFTTQMSGYEHDDVVGYDNPANIKQATFDWKEHHAGIEVTETELKKQGIVLADGLNSVNRNRGREKEVIVDLLKDKYQDMDEQYWNGLQKFAWDDGTTDPKALVGVSAFILDNPTSATTVAGIDQSVETWWQNRAITAANGGAINASLANAEDMPLARTLNRELRQLRRFGGGPTHFFAGSSVIDQLEDEYRAKGQTTDSGFSGGGDLGTGEIMFRGRPVIYDPSLDDAGKSKYLYALDLDSIKLQPLKGYDRRKHVPERPHDQYVHYAAITFTGALVVHRRNTSGVYEIA